MGHLNKELERWNREVADVRIHGTTGEHPIDRFREERLTPLYHGSPLPGGTSRNPHGQPGGVGVLDETKRLGSLLVGTPHGQGAGRGRRGRDSEP